MVSLCGDSPAAWWETLLIRRFNSFSSLKKNSVFDLFYSYFYVAWFCWQLQYFLLHFISGKTSGDFSAEKSRNIFLKTLRAKGPLWLKIDYCEAFNSLQTRWTLKDKSGSPLVEQHERLPQGYCAQILCCCRSWRADFSTDLRSRSVCVCVCV